ncbi:MAG: hypothetical protein RH859_05495 [Longimicrobiales bacterium]
MVRFHGRAVSSSVVVVSLLLLAPASVAAQLGGLVKRAARGAVEDRVEAALPFTPRAAPEFNDRVLEIGPSHLDGLLAGFAAEVEYAKGASREFEDSVKAFERRHEAWERSVEEYDRAMERYEPCRERFLEQEEATSTANQARTEAALEGKNDPATQRKWEEYQQEVARMAAEQQRRMLEAAAGVMAESRRERTEDPRLVEACGAAPERQDEPMSSLSSPEGVLAARGAEASGLTAAQYSIMRERVLYWAREEGRPRAMGFTEAEIRLLDERSEDVEKAVERMRKGKVPL